MLKLSNPIPPHLGEHIIFRGNPESAEKAMIMIHGRGATAESMAGLADEFKVDKISFIIPQAANFTWYPYRFIEKREANEPGISSGLSLIDAIVNALNKNGIEKDDIYMLGFSQGACLTIDYVARNPDKFGGIFVLSGGLIGDVLNINDYKGNLQQTPVFFGCSDRDFHIPEARVHESAEIISKLNGHVIKRIYPAMGHTINTDEIDFIRQEILK